MKITPNWPTAWAGTVNEGMKAKRGKKAEQVCTVVAEKRKRLHAVRAPPRLRWYCTKTTLCGQQDSETDEYDDNDSHGEHNIISVRKSNSWNVAKQSYEERAAK